MWRAGKLKAWFVQNRYYAIGLGGVMLCALFSSLLCASGVKWLAASDEALHLDYAHQLSEGKLPMFEQRAQFPYPHLVRELTPVPPVQWVAQHPPLYYALLSPIVSGSINQGSYRRAVFFGRLFSVFIAIVATLCVAFAGYKLVDHDKQLWSLSLAGLFATSPLIASFGGAIYNDILLVLLSVIAWIVCINILRQGPTPRNIAAISLVSALGMSVRLAYINMVGIVLVTFLVANYVRGKSGYVQAIKRSIIPALVVLSTIVVAIGWFYIRNKQLAGNYAGSHADWAIEHLHRHTKPLIDVVRNLNFWTYMAKNLYSSRIISLLVFFGGLAIVIQSIIQRGRNLRVSHYTAALLGLHFLSLLVQQAVYVSGTGGVNARYYAPSILFLLLVQAAVAFKLPRFRPLIILALMSLSVFTLIVRMIEFGSKYHPIRSNPFAYIEELIGLNGFSFPALYTQELFFVLLVGLAMVGLALFKLNKAPASGLLSEDIF